MAKFGYLYLNNGTWNGKQIVPAEWVAKSTETHFLPWQNRGYGYQWWTLPTTKVYDASGLYGQRIFVVPDHDMVVVFTANIRKGPDPEIELLQDFILPAVKEEAATAPGVDFLVVSVLIVLVVSILVVGVYWVARTSRTRTKTLEDSRSRNGN